MDIKIVEKYAREFRDAIDEVVKEKLCGRLRIFELFPNECCSYTSDLFAEYLMNKGMSIEEIKIIEGESTKTGDNHCWLLINNEYFVDITADQFNKKIYLKKYQPISKYYIVPCNYKCLYDFFDNKKERDINKIGIRTYYGDVLKNLEILYEIIIKKISKSL